MRIAATLILSLSFAGATSAQEREPRPDIVRAAAASVVRVQAGECAGGVNRTGSGFVWPEPGDVITALHLVADCDRLSVEFVEFGLQRPAWLERNLPRADLALLKVNEPPSAPPLETSDVVAEQEALAAIGLPLNIRSWQETYGRRTARPPGPLDEILNPRARDEIRRLGVPDLQLEIFRLDAVVKPGSSGGPVINRHGQVVGIVNGGLDGGSSALNWAVPVRYLVELRDRGEVDPTVGLGAAAQDVFSYSFTRTPSPGGPRAVVENVNEEIRCGGRTYFKLASRTIGEMVGSLSELQGQGVLDDPAGFVAMVNAFSTIMPAAEIMELRYDLLVDAATAATIAVPWGTRLDDHGYGCVAAARASAVELAFLSQNLASSSLMEVQRASLEFDRLVGNGYEFVGCQFDPMLIEPMPHVRYDGTVGRRQGAYGYHEVGGHPNYVLVAYLARGDSFAGVVAVNENYVATGLGGDPVVTRDWVSAALAVLLSTYQI